ncbi:hypothetical protein EXIGLDRAFT_778215 [Exidia glandulosa HHB12029]|uniref:TRP C-terminal domain-containing protein n=1 Tax=Exidia glandulosa HHB12029 TaxID=1314781 RepID=A0A165CMR5_EXIGL|nr:hypothetical protein EXIGLDRAFT_778215 [Exidia glandulosa HHB12029]
MKDDYAQILKGYAILVAFVCLLPVMVFAFFQWTFKDSWFATLVSVLLVIPVIGGCVYPLARTFLASRRVDAGALSSLPELSYIAPVTFGQFRPQRWSFTDLTIISFFVKALVIVLGRPHGLFQIIFLLCLEVLFCVALCVAKPYRSKGGDAMAIFLAVIRILTVGLLIPFAQSLSIKPIPRAALGMGSAVVSSVTVVVLFFSIVINALWGTFRVPRIPLPWRRHPRSPSPDSAGSSTKRGSADSWIAGEKTWSPTSPSASAKEHLASLPPRPGPPELESRFVTPVRDLGPQYADAPYSASGMSEFTVTDYSEYLPSSPGHQPSSNRHSSASISSYGVWNGQTNASAPSTPSTSSAYHSAAAHSQRLEVVDEYISDTDRRTSMSSRTERGDSQHR